MEEKERKTYLFAEFQFDTQEKILRQSGKEIPLSPKVSDVLCLLVEKQGKIVSKDEIMNTVWADSFVEEGNLSQAIYTIRRALGKDENGKQIVETIPRRGFRISIPIIESDLPENAAEIRESAKTVKKSFFNHYKTAGLGLMLIIVSGLLTGFLVNYFLSSKPISGTVENVIFQKLTFSGDISFPIISPDGKSFAYVRGDGIYLQDINTGSNFKLNIPEQKVFGNLQFSVDNETIFFRNESSFDAGGTLFQVSRFGGAAKKIADNVWSSPGFSPDGKQMAFMRFSPAKSRWILIVKNLETAEEKELIWRDAPFTLYRTGFPVWSFDGKKIATVEQTPNQKKISNLIIINTETGATETLETDRLIQIEQLAWQPQDKGLVLVGREDGRFFQLWKIAYPDGELQKITNDLSIYRTLSLSSDGAKLLARQQTVFSHLWTAKTNNFEDQKQITFGNLNRDGVNEGIAWMKDNQKIIYSSRITGNVDLWMVDVVDGSKKQLTENTGTHNETPVLSIDERHIYFSSTRTGKRHIWRMDITGENPLQMTFSEKEIDFHPAISPDGKWLYFVRKGNSQNAIWRKSLTDEKLEQVTEAGKYAPENFLLFSPDGKWLGFRNFVEKSKENANAERVQFIFISTDNSAAPKIFNIASNVARITWAADGQSFYYIENSAENAKIWQQFFTENESPKIILSLQRTYLNDFTISPDGENVVFSRGKNESDVILLKKFE
jgi:Tol biopolymer transport system component/DNA-binding winged helix-turn-helix (wHTH) protein